ncbi:unnamed protein product, partial [Mycena citricolor]
QSTKAHLSSAPSSTRSLLNSYQASPVQHFNTLLLAIYIGQPLNVSSFHLSTTLAMFSRALIVFVTLLHACTLNVSAHGTITKIQGANGVAGAGFGIIASTPRDGSRPNPFEQDTSVIRNQEIDSGRTGACGRTKAGGNNDVTAQLAAASSAGLPSAAADGSVTMTLHQVNGDGAGPYTCDVSGDGGNTFQAAVVTTQVPGTRSRSKATATDFPLVAQMPAGMACTGGPNGDACIMRCRNSAAAGPFGSCVAVTGPSNAAAAAAPAAAVPAAAAPAAAVPAAAAPAAAVPAAAAPAAAVPAAAAPAAAVPAAAVPAAAGASTPKRYVDSRIVGKRTGGYWLDAQ